MMFTSILFWYFSWFKCFNSMFDSFTLLTMAWSQVPAYAEITDDKEINYLCSLRDDKEYNVKFVQKKQTIVIRNCDETGTVLDIALSESKLSDKPWILLTIRKFNIDGFGISVPVCFSCSPELKQISSIQTYENQKCLRKWQVRKTNARCYKGQGRERYLRSEIMLLSIYSLISNEWRVGYFNFFLNFKRVESRIFQF